MKIRTLLTAFLGLASCLFFLTGYGSTVYTSFPETFESGHKTAYQSGNIVLPSGTWEFDDALLGMCSDDCKNGSTSVRIANTGWLTMMFNVTNGASQVSVAAGKYGTDASCIWQLWYSTNNGVSWSQSGSNVTSTTNTLTSTTFPMSITGNVRFQIRKVAGGRLNIDDFSITDNIVIILADTIPTRDNNMAMGNPSGATLSSTDSNNYLMVKAQYTLSYNNSKGMANWVSWHLSRAWEGSALRCDCFTQDGALPAGFFKATSSNYTSSGFDRGHLCPSEDRTASDTDNANTFKMTNISPQAPNMNQITWLGLETYCRTLVSEGNELYIIAGGYGSGGSGSTGGTTNTIDGGVINVPAHYWKVVVVLPVGINDVSRVTASTRVIAIDLPNTQDVSSHTWDYFRTSVDAIEAATGYNFLSNVSTTIQSTIEARVDTFSIH